MVERRPEQKRPFSQEMVPQWYRNFALHYGLGLSGTAVWTDILDYSPNPNVVALASAGVLFVASRMSNAHMEREVRQARYEAYPTDNARTVIDTQMELLPNPRFLAKAGGAASMLAAQAYPESPYMALVLGTAGVIAVSEGEARLTSIGKNIVKSLRDTGEGPHPLLDRAR